MATTLPTDTESHRRRRWSAAAAILLVLLLLLGRLAVLGGSDASPRDRRAAGSTGSTSSTTAPTADAAVAAAVLNDPFAGMELSDGDAEVGEPGPVDLDPVGEPPTADPCDALGAEAGHLLVTPDPLVLPSGDLADELHVRNCGAAAIDWTAATKPSVTLDASAGALAPGELTTVPFTIQHDAWDPGAIDFKIKVSEPGHNHYVDVHAFRPAVGADLVAGTTLSGGPGVGGCADQCITQAELSTAYSTPDVSLEVSTTVPATVRVYLSTHAPVPNGAGDPWFPGVLPKVSPTGVQHWTTGLDGLQPATKYFIIVKATDGQGHSARQSGSFTTITPLEGPTDLAGNDPEPGCANQCLTTALFTPGDGPAPGHLKVRSHTPARFRLLLSLDAPADLDGVPAFGIVEIDRASGTDYSTSWDIDVAGLQPSTHYYGIVVATDANGHRSYRSGQLTTDAVSVAVTVHKIRVTQDGDDGDANRGELRFRWFVGEDNVGYRPEDKLSPGDEVGFRRNESTYVIHDATGILPTITVAGYERDSTVIGPFCAIGAAVPDEPGYDKDCRLKWNLGTIGSLRVESLANLARCSEVGLDPVYADDACTYLFSEDVDADRPEFRVLFSIRIIGAID